MRESTVRVDQDKLQTLSKLHKGARIATKLNISKQRWHNYKTGRHDVPESIVAALCAAYGLERDDLVITG